MSHFCVIIHPLEFSKCSKCFELHDLNDFSGQIFKNTNKNYYCHFVVEEFKERLKEVTQ